LQGAVWPHSLGVITQALLLGFGLIEGRLCGPRHLPRSRLSSRHQPADLVGLGVGQPGRSRLIHKSAVANLVTKVLYLKSGVTALPDGTVIGYRPLVDDPRIFPTFLPVPEEHDAAVVDLGDGVVMSKSGVTIARWPVMNL
jgi:hypothetical protein